MHLVWVELIKLYSCYLSSDISWLFGLSLLEKSTLILQTIISDMAFSRSQIKVPPKSGRNNSGSAPHCFPNCYQVQILTLADDQESIKDHGILQKNWLDFIYYNNILFQKHIVSIPLRPFHFTIHQLLLSMIMHEGLLILYVSEQYQLVLWMI